MLELNKIHNIDCIEGMELIENNTVDLIVTSPPYNIGEGGSAFKFRGYDVYDDNNSDYDNFIIIALNEMYRILKPSGSLMFNHKVRTVNKECIHPLKLIFGSNLWAVSSVGRTPGLHPGGQEFKSPTVHQFPTGF